MMKNDPEYKSLMQKQARQQDENQIEAVTQDQVEETRVHARKVVHTFQQVIAKEHGNVVDLLNWL